MTNPKPQRPDLTYQELLSALLQEREAILNIKDPPLSPKIHHRLLFIEDQIALGRKSN